MIGSSWGAVIVAAGSGERFGSAVPKQFLPLAGKPLVDWSIDAFRGTAAVGEIVVVTPAGESDWTTWWHPPRDVLTVPGGPRRQDSVMAGLRALRSSEFVLVHDAARPMVTPGLAARVMEAVTSHGAAVPVLPVRDTVKEIDSATGLVSSTIPRERLGLSQTPQGYRLRQLLRVLSEAGDVTDECAAMEEAGIDVVAVPGELLNLKVTEPRDLRYLETLAGGGMETRTGIGIDFHPYREGIPLMLGGCLIESTEGLHGHSDGDAVLHAVADALLSASRLGDIGAHFPPEDDRWKGADSSVILGKVAGMVRGQGWELRQLDVTVISEHPRISPLRESIIQRMADILDVTPDRIWVKGTTTNSLGDIGRGRGLGCLAAAVIERSPAACTRE